MAKAQKRSTREARKPKATDKKATKTPKYLAGTESLQIRSTPTKPIGKK